MRTHQRQVYRLDTFDERRDGYTKRLKGACSRIGVQRHVLNREDIRAHRPTNAVRMESYDIVLLIDNRFVLNKIRFGVDGREKFWTMSLTDPLRERKSTGPTALRESLDFKIAQEHRTSSGAREPGVLSSGFEDGREECVG